MELIEKGNYLTYYLGAGASVAAVPVVAGFSDGLLDLVAYLKRPGHLLTKSDRFITAGDQSKRAYQEKFIERIEQFIQEIEQKTPDQVIQNYYQNNRFEEVLKLKAILCVYISFAQHLKGYDGRYGVLATKFSKVGGLLFPEDIKIINWNYDHQMIIALLDTIPQAADVFRVFPEPTGLYGGIETNDMDYTMVQLNGFASVRRQDEDWDWAFDLKTKVALDKDYSFIVDKYVEIYANFSQRTIGAGNSVFSLSFEGSRHMVRAIEISQRIAKRTEILVVVGYSFPIYNIETDRKIIESMSSLKKVYVQCPGTDLDLIKLYWPEVEIVGENDDVKTMTEFKCPKEYVNPHETN